MTDDYLQKVNDGTEKALKVLKKIEADKKFSEFAREKFNEVGINGNSTKAEDMLETLHTMVYRDWETDRKSTRLNSSHSGESRMPSSA